MGLKKPWEVRDVDYPPHRVITEATRQISISEQGRFRGSVRHVTGRFYTDAEYEQRRNKVLNHPLP